MKNSTIIAALLFFNATLIMLHMVWKEKLAITHALEECCHELEDELILLKKSINVTAA